MASFYDPRIKISDETFQLSEEESKHICRVLRLKENDTIESTTPITMLLIEPHKVEMVLQETHSKPSLSERCRLLLLIIKGITVAVLLLSVRLQQKK